MSFDHLPNPLPVPIKDGACGAWRIETFTLEENDVFFENLRALRNGNPELQCKPGIYTRLVHSGRGVIMSNTPMEVRTNSTFIRAAKGRVLINGLGLGMLLRAVLDKPEVAEVVVFEIDKDVIQLVGPGFKDDISSGRLVIREQDCLVYKPAKGEKYDCAWHDIWDDISSDNLKQMTALKRKWSRRVGLQACWSESMVRRDKRRYS